MNAPACTAGRGIHLFSHRKSVCIFVIPLFHFPQAKLQFFLQRRRFCIYKYLTCKNTFLLL